MIGIAAALFLALVAGIALAVVYDPPSCADGAQNQDEEGVDCGGSCAYLCDASAAPLRVSFARALSAGNRTDLLAYVENRNPEAEARRAPYTAEIFGEDGTLRAKREGVLDIPARATVPLFIPGLYGGDAPAARAFVSFGGVKWSAPREGSAPVRVERAELVPGTEPRVNATVANPSARAVYGQKLVVTVFDAAGIALVASQTVVREVPAQGEAAAVFTWSAPFPGEPARIEVLPVPVLP